MDLKKTKNIDLGILKDALVKEQQAESSVYRKGRIDYLLNLVKIEADSRNDTYSDEEARR